MVQHALQDQFAKDAFFTSQDQMTCGSSRGGSRTSNHGFAAEARMLTFLFLLFLSWSKYENVSSCAEIICAQFVFFLLLVEGLF